MKKKTFAAAVYASFTWNLYLVGGVILGASFALERAAGGQFEVFPTYIRFVYLFNFALIVSQVVIFGRYQYGVAIKRKWIVKAFVILGILGILANALSRSTNERWNVIPAAIITFAFYRILKSETKSSEKAR